jgi:hypothetical protein
MCAEMTDINIYGHKAFRNVDQAEKTLELWLRIGRMDCITKP